MKFLQRSIRSKAQITNVDTLYYTLECTRDQISLYLSKLESMKKILEFLIWVGTDFRNRKFVRVKALINACQQN